MDQLQHVQWDHVNSNHLGGYTMLLLLVPGAVGLLLTFILMAHDVVIEFINASCGMNIWSYEDSLTPWTWTLFSIFLVQALGIVIYACLFWGG